MPASTTCDPSGLAARGEQFKGLVDPQQFQALKTYLMAVFLKTISQGNLDYTNWCNLAAAQKANDSLPDYEQRAAFLQMLLEAIENLNNDNPADTSEATVRNALSCWCCSVSPKQMENMEIFLWCQILAYMTTLA